MQTPTSETESKSHDLCICVHHNTLRAPGPQGQGNGWEGSQLSVKNIMFLKRWRIAAESLLATAPACSRISSGCLKVDPTH